MKIAFTLVAVAASGLFAAGDPQLQTPTKPTDLPDPGVGTSSCGCGGASPAAGQESGGEWDIDPCVVETDEEVDIPSGSIDNVR